MVTARDNLARKQIYIPATQAEETWIRSRAAVVTSSAAMKPDAWDILCTKKLCLTSGKALLWSASLWLLLPWHPHRKIKPRKAIP